MFRPIPCIEQPSTNAHKSIIVLALEKAVTMSVDLGDRIGIRDADMMRLNSHKFAVFGVCGVDGEEALPLTALREEPEVRECGSGRAWY